MGNNTSQDSRERTGLTIKDIAQLMRLSTETIRYYERKKIISPQRSENNDYRYYTQEDIRKLYDFKTYQELGFSVSDISDIFSKSSAHNLNERLSEQEIALEKQMRMHAQTMQRMRQIKSAIHLYKQYYGQYLITYSPHWLTCFHSPRSVFSKKNVAHHFWDLIATNFNDFTCTARVPLGIAKDRDCYTHMDRGYSIDFEKGIEFGLEPDGTVIEIPSCRCAYTVIQSEPVVNGEALNPIFDWINARNMNPCGDVLCGVNMITFNQNEDSRIYEVWIPIEEN